MKNCTDCILDSTDACPRGAGRAVDDSICSCFLDNKEEVIKEDVWKFAIHCMELGYGVDILKLYTASEAMAKLEKFKKLEQEPCEDAIRRQAVLNTLDSMDKALDVDRTVENYKALLKECFENLTPVQPKVQTGWIPIKTRPLTEKEKAEMGTESSDMYDCPLPDDGEEVEITTHLGDVTMDIFCRESGGCYFENYCDDGDVLAWRHKPEPYKAESEDKE